MGDISLTINGKVETHDVGDNTLLVDFIREKAGLPEHTSVVIQVSVGHVLCILMVYQ